MSYQYKGKPAATPVSVLNVEQERRRNAELAMQLRRLELERQSLEREGEKVLSTLQALRSHVDRTRDETRRLAAYKEAMKKLPPPVHGGREGLLAATAEMEAHRPKPKPRQKEYRGPSHGTRRRYYDWKCRCEACNEWASVESSRNRKRYNQRRTVKEAA